MPQAPHVTIVIPVHNDVDTVTEAVESALRQLPDGEIEIICVDDASDDGTTELLMNIVARCDRIRLIVHERNLSAFQARRTGVLAARGEYILFLDGDDQLLPGAVERTVPLARQRGVDLVGFAVKVLTVDGRTVGGYQSRLRPQHRELRGVGVLSGLFPEGEPAQGQLWRYLFRTQILRDAYDALPSDLVLPRVNDLPLLYVVAMLATRYVSVDDELYLYRYGRGGSGREVDSLEQAAFYTEAIRSIESIRATVERIARKHDAPRTLLDNYDSVRLSLVGYVCSYLLTHTPDSLLPAVMTHLHERASTVDLVVAAVRFYPDTLPALKAHGATRALPDAQVRNVLLTTRSLSTGGVSGVLVAQAQYLMDAGYGVTIVARRYGSDLRAVPIGARFVEMVGKGLADRLVEWVGICREYDINVIIDHQVLYSRDWPEYALAARGAGVGTIGWLHNFAGRPLYDLNGLHELLQDNAPLLKTLVALSPLDVAFWKLRGVAHSVYVPNPPSPMVRASANEVLSKRPPEHRIELVWWGRLDEHTKQVTQLIDVAEELRKTGTDFQLTVIGPRWADWSPERFNKLVAARKLTAHVRAIGELRGDDLVRAIDASDALVSTSIIEGYQLTIAEAQIRGLPVFMYELPWLTLVADNHGIVSVPQQESRRLARQIAAVFADPSTYAELSRASVIAAKRELSHDFGGLYTQVISGELPAAYSPEPTVEDAAKLLDLMIFFAERNAGARIASQMAAASSPPPAAPVTATPRRSTSILGDPRGESVAARAWRAVAPLGRSALQLFPALRPIAHRAKRTIELRQK